MMSKPACIQFACLALAVTLTSCGGRAHMQGDIKSGLQEKLRLTQLRIGVDPDAAPMVFDDGGQIRGVEAEFGVMLAEALGLEPVFVSHPFSDLQWELGGGQIDIIMAGMSVTPSRQRRLAFSNPYTHIGQQALIRKPDSEKFAASADILDTTVTVAVESGTTGSFFASEKLRHAKVYEFPSLGDAVGALRAAKVDVVIHDSVSVMWAARQRSDELMTVPGLLTDEPLAWAMRTTNTQLVQKVNAVLQQWQADGTVERVLKNWLDESSYITSTPAAVSVSP